MICVHVSYTPLAGAPIRIVNALNKWTDIKARLINLNPNIYGDRVFEEDLIWEKDIEEALRLIANADIICFHHWMKLDDNGFKINFLNIAKKNCKFVRQFHSNLDTITGGDKNLKEIILNENIPILSALPRKNFPKNNYSAFPRIVIPHYPERSILNAKIVPNIIPINDENYKPIKQDNDKPTIFYSYTFNNEGFSSRWDTKGYPEVSLLLEQFKDSANIKKITNIPFFECLRIKRNSDIVIDDIITGSYHLTSLEALSQGKTTLAYLDNRTQYILRELTGASELPFVNVKMEEAKYVLEELLQDKKLREEIGDYSRKWMEKYYNDKDLVKIYKKVYEDILNGKDISREYPKNANKWLSIDIEYLIWKARKENYEALHKDKNNRFALLKISKDNEYIRLIFFGIKITFKINEEKINKIAWWIPIRKWRDEFRNKFNDNFIRGGVNYKSYWINDNCNNIIPKNWGEFPEGFNVIDFLREITEELDFKSVLDFGCGYGRLSKAFDSDKYLGIDLNYKALKIARDNNAGYKYEETFIDTEYYPNSDLTNVYTVFLHLDDNTLEEVLLKLSKSTNKYILISEVMGREWRRDGLPPVFCREKEEYIKYLNKYGFELYKEYDKPYKRYIEDKNWDDKKNRNISFLIFRKY